MPNRRIKIKRQKNKKGSVVVRSAMNNKRYCSVKTSLKQSLKEVKSIRNGKTPERSLDDLFANIEKWTNEDR